MYLVANDCSDQLKIEGLVHLNAGINDEVRNELCGKGRGSPGCYENGLFFQPLKRSKESEKGIDHSAAPRLLTSWFLDG
jgi:hypothetical protein